MMNAVLPPVTLKKLTVYGDAPPIIFAVSVSSCPESRSVFDGFSFGVDWELLTVIVKIPELALWWADELSVTTTLYVNVLPCVGDEDLKLQAVNDIKVQPVIADALPLVVL